MRTLYIHIGRPKTGTTSLQQTLQSNQKLLARKGLRYLKTGNWAGAHHQIAAALQSERETPPWIERSETANDQLLANLTRELRFLRRDAVLSSEALWGSTRDQIKVLAAALPNDLNIKIVMYLRRQDRAFESALNQGHKDRSLNRSLEELLASDQLRRNLDYYRTAQRWADIFGADNTSVRIYEDAKKAGGTVQDFLSIVDKETIKFADLKKSKNLANQSLCLRGLNFVQNLPLQANSHTVGFIEDADQVMPDHKKLLMLGAPYILSPELRRALMDRYALGNEAIGREFLKNGGVDPFDPDLSQPDASEEDLTLQDVAQMSLRLWKVQTTKLNDLNTLRRNHVRKYKRISAVLLIALCAALIALMLR